MRFLRHGKVKRRINLGDRLSLFYIRGETDMLAVSNPLKQGTPGTRRESQFCFAAYKMICYYKKHLTLLYRNAKTKPFYWLECKFYWLLKVCRSKSTVYVNLLAWSFFVQFLEEKNNTKILVFIRKSRLEYIWTELDLRIPSGWSIFSIIVILHKKCLTGWIRQYCFLNNCFQTPSRGGNRSIIVNIRIT